MKNWKIIVTLGVAGLILSSATAWARPGMGRALDSRGQAGTQDPLVSEGGPRGGGPRGGGPRGGGLVRELIHPCPSACRDADRLCVDAARETALACGKTTCPSEITAAQTACGEGSPTDDCDSAREELGTCLEDCLTVLREAATACRTEARACVEACSSTTE